MNIPSAVIRLAMFARMLLFNLCAVFTVYAFLFAASGVWAATPKEDQPARRTTRDAEQPGKPSPKKAQPPQQKAQGRTGSVYDNQPVVTGKELMRFLETLPQFRSWCRANNENPQPVVRNNKADFAYSTQAADWISKSGWQPERFFCVLGRLATALVIVEEGNSSIERPPSMPAVLQEDIELTRRHLSAILKALDRGGDSTPPITR